MQDLLAKQGATAGPVARAGLEEKAEQRAKAELVDRGQGPRTCK